MKLGACGYFTQGQANRSWNFEPRSCDDPEAALVVVREIDRAPCLDDSFSWSDRAKRRQYVCTQLNAQVGDCFNDPGHKYAHLDLLRKVPCTAPGAHQVNTRVERDDSGACAAAKDTHDQTVVIHHPKPPVSYCLHPVGH
ncbi:hypothetical protein [Nocardia sp. NPDC019395]|uniref:hypothetical protein n=1 Tax=Nocardia sp. NPDC019395 TaxID=3154686 RepID=UPI0033FF8E93